MVNISSSLYSSSTSTSGMSFNFKAFELATGALAGFNFDSWDWQVFAFNIPQLFCSLSVLHHGLPFLLSEPIQD